MCGYVEDGDIMTMLRAVIRAGMEALRGARSAAGINLPASARHWCCYGCWLLLTQVPGAG